ncbi:MAG TPA: hemerythrin domain-containing protein [Acidimicrobiales bacterium]|jgi:hemerythrin-like domain-containing protein
MDDTQELTDTSDMVNLHRVFRNAMDRAPALIASVPEGDLARAALVASYYDNVLSLLHVHHDSEDQLVWPRLLERCPDDAATVSRIAAQHGDVVESLAVARQASRDWAATASARDAAVLQDALATLQADLTPHLDDEEEFVLPIAARYLSPEEWGELPSHGMRAFDGDKLWLIMGLVSEQMSAAQQEMMRANFPPPVAEMWANFGQQAFENFIAELNE